MLMGRFNDTDAKNYSDRTTEILRRDYESTYPYLDHMNNTPQQTQELSTKQTQLQDTINNLNKRISGLENTLAQRTNNILIQKASEIIDQMTTQQRTHFYQKIMTDLSTEPTYSKLIQFTKPPEHMTPQQ
jgi:predicted unusual protein kinase regulating ubiquinone biosynthesis (AarF/ABC1/UbiB family)